MSTGRPTTYHARRCAATLGLHWPEAGVAGTPQDETLLVFFAGIDEDCAHNLHLVKLAHALPACACVGVEYPGHGRSSGARGELPGGDAAALLDDLADCVRFLAAGAAPRAPACVLLAGHSLGGLVALLLPAAHPQLGAALAGVIALAPAVDVVPLGCCARCHCAGGTRRHSCSLARPACAPVRALLRALLRTPAAALLLPAEDPRRAAPQLPRAELELASASLAVRRMRPSGLLAILALAARLHGSAAWGSRAQPPLLLLTGGRDGTVPAASLRALAASRALRTWPPADAGFSPAGGCGYALCAREVGHALLAGGVRWARDGAPAGHDVAAELLLPAIALWVEAQCRGPGMAPPGAEAAGQSSGS